MEFWLVQRLELAAGHTQVTKLEHLSFDYMGAAEFEFGALPRARQSMSASNPTMSSVVIKAFDTEATFHIVAPMKMIDSVGLRLQKWFDRNCRTKEVSRLDAVITRKGRRGTALIAEEFSRLPVAWWALNEDVFFTMEKNIAKIWLDSLQQAKNAA
ncbi:hypothetical protein JNK62_00020 [bacterium]|nr:hypothetical protein [bacterium]